ncbi:leucine-rich repeat domain-containing protein, partial [Bifidobacterium boum]|uniref:leucine-rich repeat domain-containing protein n=1 Tax=Bifidobacterium boum TaxID=78343 RepID=UPI0039930B1F
SVKKFVVSFDSAGGSGVASQSVAAGGRVVRPVDPSRSGYVFAGWYTKAGEPFDFNSAAKSDVTLVARWRPVVAPWCVLDESTIAQCFPDEALARSIAEELGADNTDEVLTSEDVNNTTRLWVRDPTVASVQGLQVFTNLESLNLSYAGVYSTGFSDVSPLAKLTKLEELDLSHTAVSDVSPLAGLTKLRRLSLSTTPVSDVSPLAKLTNLQELNLSSAWGYSNSTGLSDVSPLAKLTKLEELDLSHTAVSDVSPLAKLTKLHFL